MGKQARVEPGLFRPHEVRMHRQALPQCETRFRGEPGEFVDLGPGSLRVDVVGCQGGNPAPVIDPRAKQKRQLLRVGQVRWGLEARARAEYELGDRHGGDVLLEGKVVPAHHRGRHL